MDPEHAAREACFLQASGSHPAIRMLGHFSLHFSTEEGAGDTRRAGLGKAGPDTGPTVSMFCFVDSEHLSLDQVSREIGWVN